MRDYNVAVIISGRGSTFMAFYEACKNGLLPGVNPRLLISTNSKAKGLERARAAGFPESDIFISAKSKYRDSLERGEAILAECRRRDIQLIALMGCLMIVPDNVHEVIPTLNQHPARTPEFGGDGMEGLTVHRAVINFVRAINRPFVTEPTVHIVTKVLDEGPVVGIRRVPVLPDDTPESLDERVIGVEHELVQTTIYLYSQGRVGYFERTTPLTHSVEEEQLLAKAKADASAAAKG